MAWDLLEENFNDLTDWTDNDYGNGVSEISPAGQLHQDSVNAASIARIYQDIGTIGTGDYTFEIKVLFDVLPTTETTAKNLYFQVSGTTHRVNLYFTKGTLQTHAEVAGYTTLITKAWALDTWYTVRCIVHNSQNDMDVYLDGELEYSDGDVEKNPETDGVILIRANPWQQEVAEWHVDYIYIGAGQQVPSTTSIKKVSGVAYASIKKIGGVAIGSVKKIAGVE